MAIDIPSMPLRERSLSLSRETFFFFECFVLYQTMCEKQLIKHLFDLTELGVISEVKS